MRGRIMKTNGHLIADLLRVIHLVFIPFLFRRELYLVSGHRLLLATLDCADCVLVCRWLTVALARACGPMDAVAPGLTPGLLTAGPPGLGG